MKGAVVIRCSVCGAVPDTEGVINHTPKCRRFRAGKLDMGILEPAPPNPLSQLLADRDRERSDTFSLPDGGVITFRWPKQLKLENESRRDDLASWLGIVCRKIMECANTGDIGQGPPPSAPVGIPRINQENRHLYRCECGAAMSEREYEYSLDHACGGRWIKLNPASSCVHCKPGAFGKEKGPTHATDCALYASE